MGNIVIVDIDGTIADGDHRLHHIQKQPRDWESFYAEVHLDAPIPEMTRLVNVLAEAYTVVLLTGRRESTRAATEKWLADHEISYHALIMRPDGNFTDDHELKPIFISLFGKDNVELILEDRTRIVKELREHGYRVLQVAQGDF